MPAVVPPVAGREEFPDSRRDGLRRVRVGRSGNLAQVGYHFAMASKDESGDLAPAEPTNGPQRAVPPADRWLLSETPIHSIWLRLRQMTSVTLATKLVEQRAKDEGVALESEVVRSKAEGLAFALRNASDYFHAPVAANVSQRVVNVYYGSLAFAFAEMLAAPRGATALADIEDSTKQGHGLYTIDGEPNDLEHLVVGVLASGFYTRWLASAGLQPKELPSQRPKRYSDMAGVNSLTWTTLEQLFARVPEVSDLFLDIFPGAPAWAIPDVDFDSIKVPAWGEKKEPPSRSNIILVDLSTRMTTDTIRSLPGPISGIAEMKSDEPGRRFRAIVDHPEQEHFWDALPVHRSPFINHALIAPAFGTVSAFRAICVALLYALSIVVRYRPSIWRRVQEGDLDHMRVLIEAFLEVVERVLPEQFLETVSGHRVFARPRGTL